jgi:Zn ribbon nucleic-acid-binding protein
VTSALAGKQLRHHLELWRYERGDQLECVRCHHQCDRQAPAPGWQATGRKQGDGQEQASECGEPGEPDGQRGLTERQAAGRANERRPRVGDGCERQLEEGPCREQEPAHRLARQSQNEEQSDTDIDQQAHDSNEEGAEELEQHDVDDDRTDGDERRNDREEAQRPLQRDRHRGVFRSHTLA